MGFRQYLEESKVEPKEYSEKELKAREKKKSDAVKTLSSKIDKIKSKVSSDLNSSDDKVRLTALAIAIINITKERNGNDNSANGIRKDMDTGKMKDGQEKHYGVTGLRKQHVSFSNGNATLKYVGKSSVKQTKVITNSKVVSILKELSKKNSGFLLTTEDGIKIKPTDVNNYLKDYEVTAKDLRAFGANDLIIKELKGKSIPKDEKERKDLFLSVAEKVSEELGHSRTMLRNSYLIQGLEDDYILKGKIKKLSSST